ncbi:hypothetical protein H696_04760 [Fonticula alba]|uniref:Ribosomal protein S18 n=1 Tax=Fonticula alba TaxID=691883 RepID=A0A058Z2Z9_FONAL|nr:hypothetical protein H696_04760 [Fonticula alba]KCV68466.1 hypothetical protein H696_04760 [Fonticula alba]|eukprot:XP_009496898.1 hypothetical protein H696_04760 [Fonticula alba]
MFRAGIVRLSQQYHSTLPIRGLATLSGSASGGSSNTGRRMTDEEFQSLTPAMYNTFAPYYHNNRPLPNHLLSLLESSTNVSERASPEELSSVAAAMFQRLNLSDDAQQQRTGSFPSFKTTRPDIFAARPRVTSLAVRDAGHPALGGALSDEDVPSDRDTRQRDRGAAGVSASASASADQSVDIFNALFPSDSSDGDSAILAGIASTPAALKYDSYSIGQPMGSAAAKGQAAGSASGAGKGAGSASPQAGPGAAGRLPLNILSVAGRFEEPQFLSELPSHDSIPPQALEQIHQLACSQEMTRTHISNYRNQSILPRKIMFPGHHTEWFPGSLPEALDNGRDVLITPPSEALEPEYRRLLDFDTVPNHNPMLTYAQQMYQDASLARLVTDSHDDAGRHRLLQPLGLSRRLTRPWARRAVTFERDLGHRLDHKNVWSTIPILHVRGRIFNRKKTILSQTSHRRMSKVIRRSQAMGILPYFSNFYLQHKETYIHNPNLFFEIARGDGEMDATLESFPHRFARVFGQRPAEMLYERDSMSKFEIPPEDPDWEANMYDTGQNYSGADKNSIMAGAFSDGDVGPMSD